MSAMTRILSCPVAAKIKGYGRTCNRALWGGFDSELKLEATKFLRSYQNLSDTDKLASLSTPSNLPATLICHSLSYLKGSLLLAMSLRKNVLYLLRSSNVNTSERVTSDGSSSKRKFWKEIDAEIGKWLSSAFSSDMLTIKQISFTTSSGSVLEKIANGESVHPVRNLRDLKSRLKDGRRCYALFHHQLPEEPLAFIHVGFTAQLAASLKEITTASESMSPKSAIFYSVNSLHSSLGGLDLATRLIKGVSCEIRNSHPDIALGTLSPVPGFKSWLLSIKNQKNNSIFRMPENHKNHLHRLSEKHGIIFKDESDLIAGFINVITSPTHLKRNADAYNDFRDPLTWLCGYYLLQVKNSKNEPQDPVARFHLRNGATLFRINWMSNPSQKGLDDSFGMMVNYTYASHSDQLESAAQLYEDSNWNIQVGPSVRELMGGVTGGTDSGAVV